LTHASSITLIPGRLAGGDAIHGNAWPPRHCRAAGFYQQWSRSAASGTALDLEGPFSV
jgi:hypothetical protein